MELLSCLGYWLALSFWQAVLFMGKRFFWAAIYFAYYYMYVCSAYWKEVSHPRPAVKFGGVFYFPLFYMCS